MWCNLQALRAAGRSTAMRDLGQRVAEHAEWLEENTSQQLRTYTTFAAQRAPGRNEGSAAAASETSRNNGSGDANGSGERSTAMQLFTDGAPGSQGIVKAQAGEDPAADAEARVRSVVRSPLPFRGRVIPAPFRESPPLSRPSAYAVAFVTCIPRTSTRLAATNSAASPILVAHPSQLHVRTAAPHTRLPRSACSTRAAAPRLRVKLAGKHHMCAVARRSAQLCTRSSSHAQRSAAQYLFTVELTDRQVMSFCFCR